MVSYNNSNVVQCLRQYDMFANSLNLVKTKDERNMIIKQLTKLEKKIIELTNEVYEEEYETLANKECGLLDEELNRLNMLVDLINQRLSYIEKRCNNHYRLTGETLDIQDVVGANNLDELEERIKIIEKYSKNIKLASELEKEVESLTNKITLANEKVSINESLNQELEKTFSETLSACFEKCGYYELVENREEIEYAYYETEKSLTLAELNLETAKTSPVNILNDCAMMLEDIKKDYLKYKEKVNILKLIDMFNREVNNYEELLQKRKEVNELFRHIKDEEFLQIVMPLINKQYNTILMEQQDVNTYNDLTIEKERKLEALSEINVENNSEKFKQVLEELIKNEKAKQAKLEEEKRKIEEEQKKIRLENERKKQEEILKRQKIIEEARKKEMEKRTKQLLEQQQKSVLQPKRRESGFSFETIKDLTNKQNDEVKRETKSTEIEESVHENKFNSNLEMNKSMKINIANKKEINDTPMYKNKDDIEKELFDEFNNEPKYELNLENHYESNDKSEGNNENFKDTVEDKLPKVSIDEYMKNFNENEFPNEDLNSLFKNDDSFFPNIPV